MVASDRHAGEPCIVCENVLADHPGRSDFPRPSAGRGREVLMKLILFGGAQGVGATVLLNRFLGLHPTGFDYYDPVGALQLQSDGVAGLSRAEVEERIVQEVLDRRRSPLLFCRWCYAGWSPAGFTPQIAWQRLHRLAAELHPDEISLVLVRATPVDVFIRRMHQHQVPLPTLNVQAIKEELLANEEFCRMHRATLSSVTRVSRLSITNRDFGAAYARLEGWLTNAPATC